MANKRKELGETWWAQRWLSALERFGWEYQSRLARGRTYARGGRVWQAEVRPGEVVAAVQGSRPRPYQVRIQLASFSDEVWERVIARLADEATYVAKLLAAEMPHDIEELFSAAGADLFPRKASELQSSCTCPDWASPCKHVAALHYVLAENLDAQPFLLFTLRGRTTEQVMEALRARWAGESDADDAQGATNQAEVESASDALLKPLHTEGFFRAGPELDTFSITISPPQVEAALLKRLGRPPFAGADEDPLPALTQVYAAVTQRALQALGRSAEKRRGERQRTAED
jgi:uncharacterized Zn finger protein